jgi:hypothetical protein
LFERSLDSLIDFGRRSPIHLMETFAPLTDDQRIEAKAICDEVCEKLETSDEYNYDLNVVRGKATGFPEEVWDEALRMLRKVSLDAWRAGALITVKKR